VFHTVVRDTHRNRHAVTLRIFVSLLLVKQQKKILFGNGGNRGGWCMLVELCWYVLPFCHNVADLKSIVTAQKPTSVTDSVVGHFTAPNELNLIIRLPFDQSKGSLLTLQLIVNVLG